MSDQGQGHSMTIQTVRSHNSALVQAGKMMLTLRTQIEALNFGQSLRPSHPTRPIFHQLAPDLAGEALVLITPNSSPRPLFRGALVAFTSTLLRGPQFRSGSVCGLGPVSRPPQIAVPGHFFGAPWWPPPAACSVALNCGLAVRAGISAPPNSSPRLLFRGALVAPASTLLRGSQLRSGSKGQYLARSPRIAVPGRFFGAPWWPPPARCSVALNFG